MAKKVSNNKITDISQDWGLDMSNGLPYSGQSIQDFIKEGIVTANTAYSEKWGAVHFDPNTYTLMGFKNEADKEEWLGGGADSLVIGREVFNFSGTMNQIKIINKMSSANLYFATTEQSAPITVGFLSQQKGITDTDWTDVLEDFYVTVTIDKGITGTYTTIENEKLVLNGSDYTIDVRKHLASGNNRIRITAIGALTNTTSNFIFTVYLTSMYLSPSNFTWYKPFIEGDVYNLGGMNIGGNIPKVLKIKMSKEGYERTYDVNIGSNIYTTSAYVFNGLEFPSGGTGVYHIELWLDANGLESEHLSYNIICVSQADKFTAQLVSIGNPAEKVFNFADNKLFEYCVYNKGTATASPHIKISYLVNTNPTTIIDEELVNVSTAAPLTYTASLEIEMEDESATLQLEAFMTYGNEQVFMFPVDNSKSYPATTGAVFYMNPSSRNNAQSNREKVVNSITGAEIDAVFTRMAWTDGTDGWTTDEEGRKCLRLPAGCTMDLAYQPMASVAQKTIELVYKVKNAADYDEPIFYIGDVYKEEIKEEKDYKIELVQGAYLAAQNVGLSATITANNNCTYTKPIFLKAGEKIVMQTQGTGIGCICQTDENASYYKSLVNSSNNSGYVNAEYIATEDMYVALSSRNVAFDAFQPYVIRLVAVQGEFNPNFRGIVIRPKNILIHSRDLNVNDSLQDYNTTDEETLHVLITIIPNYKTNYGNLAQIYVNGDKVRSFSFEKADRWDVDSNMKFGSNTADTYWYKARVYDRGFEMYDASKNCINSLPDTKAKEEAKAKMEAPLDDSYNLSYDECVKNGLNTMVIEILDQDQTVPSISNPSAKQCNLWVKINNPIDGELDEDFARFFSGEIIENQTIEGQGTTAMTYARWNFRWKLTSAYNKRRITAKKNFASSMHSHKMGATRLFNDLNRAIVGPNDADARVAVYQYPVYGFQKIKVEGTTDQYTYMPIGLYTIGPDKGDKKTFGFDGEYESTLIHMEGTDHTPKGVGMDYPWEELAYSGSAEALGAVNATGSVVAALEVGAAGEYDPKDNPTEVKAMLDEQFKPAYDVVEHNSTYILGVTETLAEMNADISAWQAKTDAEGRSYASLEFFTEGVYDLYFYNTRTQKYEARGINMLTDLGVSVEGLTLDEKTELFKAKRRERFVADWETYWHKNDAIFHYAFVLVFGATDNFKKNTYPYKFKAFADGGKYRWRQDDLDTLFDINNQGLAAKIYSILVGDKTDTGSGSIYRGDTSVFWTLIKECFPTEIKAMVHAIFDKMVELCPASYGKNTLEKLVGCIRYYFWDKAQEYFPTTAYCKDAEWTYEDTWAAGLYKEVNPLQQSLGGHREAEVDWVTMRMLFCAMYFNYGPFGAVNDSFSDTSTGQIAYGGAGSKKYVITMACDGNPTILRGQSELVTYGDRVKAGDVIELTVPDSSGADTRIYIQGVDWMEDIGDLSDLQVSADNPQLSVASKRLQTLKIGGEDASKVTTNVQALNFGECPSMMIVDARNAKSLTGSIDLSKMPRLLEAYFGGTAVKSVNVPNGSKIVVLQIGEETTQVSLMNLKFMDGDGFQYTSLPKLEFIRIENCSQLSPFQLLKGIYNTEGNVIRDIRVIGFDVEGDASDFAMIANMANDVDKDGNPHIYNGIDAEGKPMDNSHPVIEGKLSVAGNVYEDDYNAIKAVFPNLVMSFLAFYVGIKDPEVLRVLLEMITTDDGVGLTVEDIEGVTSIADWFQDNAVIENFDELERFIGLTSFNAAAFRKCTSLKSISIPPQITSTSINQFNGSTSLTEVKTQTPLKIIESGTFYGCSSFEGMDFSELEELRNASSGVGVFFGTAIKEFNAPKLKTVGTTQFTIHFQGTPLERVISMGSVEVFPGGNTNYGLFKNCTSLVDFNMPDTIKTIGAYCFSGCSSLKNINLPSSIQVIERNAFDGCIELVYDELNLENLVELGIQAFNGVKIKKLNLGKVTVLPASAQSYQTYGDKSVLEEVVIPEGVTSIPDLSFRGYALVKTTIPKSVTTIGSQAFYGCKALEGEVDVPNATKVDYGAFYNSAITSFNGESVTTITGGNGGDSGAFSTCKSLKSVSIPSAASIGPKAFNNCSALESIELPSAVTISYGAFGGCTGLKSIDIGALVTTIDYQAFGSSKAAEVIICRATTPPTIKTPDPLPSNTCPIFVPAASIPDYAAATNWSTYADRLAPLEDHEDGGYVKFADSAVEAICVANWDANGSGYMSKNECAAVTSVGNLFSQNTEITSFDELENFGITSMRADWDNSISSYKGGFSDCSNLASVKLPKTLKTLGQYSFYKCTSLAVDISDMLLNITAIGQYAFWDCPITGNVVMPNVSSLYYCEFANTLITGVYDLGKVGRLRGGAATSSFARCQSLKTVILPETMATIDGGALSANNSLTTIICKALTPPSITTWSFNNATVEAYYVPDESLSAYQSATNWSAYLAKIFPLSQLATDNPTLYAEIEEYL